MRKYAQNRELIRTSFYGPAFRLRILEKKLMGTVPKPTKNANSMTVEAIMTELEKMSSPAIKNVLAKHGAREPFFGVRVGDMKAIVKTVKKDHELSLALYSTGNYDAMYLAGLIADEEKISKKDLHTWAKASYAGIAEYTVPWIAAESPHGWELALEWIESEHENIAAAGWACLCSWMSIRPDNELDIAALIALMERVKKEIHSVPNRVRYAMNLFVISAGSFVPALTEKAKEIGKTIGEVTVDMNGTACKVPNIEEYIAKVEARGAIGKKKKQARC
jgi:3-methyladenine DNA glycosylase AlkD